MAKTPEVLVLPEGSEWRDPADKNSELWLDPVEASFLIDSKAVTVKEDGKMYPVNPKTIDKTLTSIIIDGPTFPNPFSLGDFHMIKVTRRSPFSKVNHTMEIPLTQAQYDACMAKWNGGAHIQNAFSMLNADQREFLMTGITPKEWAETFGQE